MATDFHTHCPKPGARALVSCRMEEVAHYPLTSLELHPWNLPGHFEPFPPGFHAALKQAAALGEIGLDRLRGPAFSVQEEYLGALLFLAEQEQKPVVLHCVRAVPELLTAVRRHPRVRRLYHGFRGKPEQLEELRRAGFYISLGFPALNNDTLFTHLKTAGLTQIGFETDDSPDPVELLLASAAAKLGMECAKLEAQTDATFDSFLR